MKKIVKLISIVGLLSLFLVGCGQNAQNGQPGSNTSQTSNTVQLSVGEYAKKVLAFYDELGAGLLKAMDDESPEFDKDLPDADKLVNIHQEVAVLVDRINKDFNALAMPSGDGVQEFKDKFKSFLQAGQDFVTLNADLVTAVKAKDADSVRKAGKGIADLGSKFDDLDSDFQIAKGYMAEMNNVKLE